VCLLCFSNCIHNNSFKISPFVYLQTNVTLTVNFKGICVVKFSERKTRVNFPIYVSQLYSEKHVWILSIVLSIARGWIAPLVEYTPFWYHPRAWYIKHTNLWLVIFSMVSFLKRIVFSALAYLKIVCAQTCRNTRAGNLTILLISKLLSGECHQVCVVNCLKQFRIPQSPIVCLSHSHTTVHKNSFAP